MTEWYGLPRTVCRLEPMATDVTPDAAEHLRSRAGMGFVSATTGGETDLSGPSGPAGWTRSTAELNWCHNRACRQVRGQGNLMNDSTERREFARVPLDVEIVVEALHERHEARAINIGELGMRFTKPPGHPTPRGTEVLLDFELPGDPEPIRILGWVASDRDGGPTPSTSVTFVFHSEAEADRIRQFVSRHRSAD